MFNLTIMADSIDELQRNLNDLTALIKLPKPQVEAPKADYTVGYEAKPAPVAPVVEAPVVEAQPAVETQPAEEEPSEPIPTVEETRAVLNALREKKTASAVKAILTDLGATSFTALPKEKYAEAISMAKAAMSV